MSSNLTSHGMFLATAMAVSGTLLLLTLRLQKSTTQFPVNPSEALPRSCISLDGKKKGKSKKKKKKVHFAEDVVDTNGNSEEYRRRMHRRNCYFHDEKAASDEFSSSSATLKKRGEIQEMPANRVALYNGILRDRLLHRVAYSH